MPLPDDQPKVDAGLAPPTDPVAILQAMLAEFIVEQREVNAKNDASFASLIGKVERPVMDKLQVVEDPSGITPETGGAHADDSGETPGDPERAQLLTAATRPGGVYTPQPTPNTSSVEPKFSPPEDGHSQNEEKTVPDVVYEIYEMNNMTVRESFLVIENWKIVTASDTRTLLRIPKHDTIKDSQNMMNSFEDSIQGDEATWLKTFPIIRHRTAPGNDQSRFEEYGSKLDNLFINQCPVFTKADKDQFQTYVEKFWEVAVRHRVEGIYFAKSQLFNQINLIYPEVCTEELKPVNEKARKLLFQI